MTALLPLAIGLVALLYAAVGHAGATGYVAVMALAGLPPQVIRPTALSLNVVVAAIGTVAFFRAGHFRGRLFWPLAAASLPCALVGGALALPTAAFEAFLGVVLLYSAGRFLLESCRRRGDGSAIESAGRSLPPAALAASGAVIGLASGLTGVGGGVFLAPALLALRAAPVRTIAGVTAPFILVNSVAGLLGGFLAGRPFPATALSLVAAAALGGGVGAHLGAFRLPVSALKLLLAAVLAFASLKLLWAAAGL